MQNEEQHSSDENFRKGQEGIIFSFEGIDASGKNTQSGLLTKALSKKFKTHYISFPDYSTVVGGEIRSFLSESKNYGLEARHLMYALNHYEHKEDIECAVSEGKVVVLNRYCDSNLAYGIASGLSNSWLLSVESRMPKSDYVFYLRISPESSLDRKSSRDRFEADLDFLKKVSLVYDALSESNGNWIKISGARAIDEIQKEILGIALGIIQERGLGTL